jgi:hypothetical protein
MTRQGHKFEAHEAKSHPRQDDSPFAVFLPWNAGYPPLLLTRLRTAPEHLNRNGMQWQKGRTSAARHSALRSFFFYQNLWLPLAWSDLCSGQDTQLCPNCQKSLCISKYFIVWFITYASCNFVSFFSGKIQKTDKC